jgi:hypothetical protein
VEIFKAIRQYNLRTETEFFAFASRQYGLGDQSWIQYCMIKGEAKVKQDIRVASKLCAAQTELDFMSMSHMEILTAALSHECICEGRAEAAWDQILEVNEIDRAAYCAAILELFESGGGKGLNHFYVGPPSSGILRVTFYTPAPGAPRRPGFDFDLRLARVYLTS